ncbi:MAG: HlyD family efflux transporter periplasmic adaptor subunit [Elusimicrobiota bacterium]
MKRPFYRKKRYIFGALIILLIGGSCAGLKKKRTEAEARRIASMTAFKPEKGDLVTKTQAAGTVEPENRVLVTPSVSGRAEEVLFEEGRSVEQGTVLAWISSSERTALLDSLKMKESTPEEKRMVEEAYNLTPVVAPISGMVIKRAVEPGQSVSPGKELAVVSDRLIVKTWVDETDIGSVKEGQRVEFYLDAFPKEKRPGRVLSISHESTVKDGVTVYEVKVLPAGATASLRSGMTADVLITTGRRAGVLMVPKRAVKYRDGGASVSVKDSPAAPLKDKDIKTGAADERMIEVKEGLAETDTVYYSTGIAGERSGFRMRF